MKLKLSFTFIFLFIFYLFPASHDDVLAMTTPTLQMQQYRWRNDNGDETTAAWRQATNAVDTGFATDGQTRLRVTVKETAGSQYNNFSGVLQYSTDAAGNCGSGTWTTLTTSTLWQLYDSTYVTDNTPTTQQISSGGFVAGYLTDLSNPPTSSPNITASYSSEFEYTFQGNGVAGSTTYYFRITAGGTALNGGYSVCATITTAAAQPTYTQNRYRWYVDNDSTNPTDPWSSITNINIAENAGITILPAKYDPPSLTQELRLRVNLNIGTANLSASTQRFKLQYKKATDANCTTGSWSDVLNNGTGGSDWEYASSSVTDGANITGVLSDTTSGKGEQYARSKPSALNNVGANVGEKIEYDFHIVGGTTWSDAAQYSFRVVKTTDGSDATVLTTYSICPTLATEPGTSRLMRHGEFLIETATSSGFFWAD